MKQTVKLWEMLEKIHQHMLACFICGFKTKKYPKLKSSAPLQETGAWFVSYFSFITIHVQDINKILKKDNKKKQNSKSRLHKIWDETHALNTYLRYDKNS